MSLYITVTGQKHYYGLLPFSVGSVLSLRPEPDNLYDPAAVAVYSPVYGKVGYAAQSADTLADGTVPASALLPHIKDGGAGSFYCGRIYYCQNLRLEKE